MNYVPLTTESKKGLMYNKDMEPIIYAQLCIYSLVRCKRKGRHNNHRQADNLTEKVNHFDK